VPSAALATPASTAADCGVLGPIAWLAKFLHIASSARNCSKRCPDPGRTITLGPSGGNTMQALRMSANSGIERHIAEASALTAGAARRPQYGWSASGSLFIDVLTVMIMSCSVAVKAT